ncbi:MAG: DUF4124 domain-containing protein [Gammaproteobacteria bacterium]|nr:DUF4124 domain-containing protein [Gammaproteobacteria bacterium]
MKRPCLVAVAALSTTLAMLTATAQDGVVYRWVDKDGTPHYQDRPPEDDSDAAELSLRYRTTDPEVIAAARKKKAEQASVAGLREDQQAADAIDAAADRQRVIDERSEGCRKAQERQKKYETAHRLYKPGPDGQRNYLSDAELDSARLQARSDVAEWCGG